MRKTIQAVIIFIVAIVIGIFLLSGILLVRSYNQLWVSTQITALIGFAGALGTLSLAAVTFYSLQITRRQFHVQEKELEKPLAIDEISNVLQPAIEALKSNIHQYEQGSYTFDWIYIDGTGDFGSRSPTSVYATDDITALYRLQTENIELFQKLKAHENMVADIGKISNNIEEKLQERIQNILAEYSEENDLAEGNVKVVIAAMLKNIDHFGESHDLHDFWEENKSELMDLLHEEAGEEVDWLKTLETEYNEHCVETLELAQTRKKTLREEFGISSEEIEFEVENTGFTFV